MGTSDGSTEGSSPIAETTTVQLVAALRGVIATGLPVTEETAGNMLPNLRSVYARAVQPHGLLSRVHSLNTLLPRLIAGLDDDRYREAEQMLFGLAPGTRATTLTARRRQAASVLGYGLDHFRARVEADLLRSVALALHEDLLRYHSRVNRAVDSLEPTGDTPRLGPEHITAEEELISRIWQHVYGLRADLIATVRMSSEGSHKAHAEDHRQAARRQAEALNALVDEYVGTYGQQLVRHGDTELTVDALARLASWTLTEL